MNIQLRMNPFTGTFIINLSIDRGFELVCPVSEIYNHTSSDRLRLMEFYESELGQIIYSWRSKSIEPLIEHIKDVFKIDPLSIRGYQKASGVALLSGTDLPNHCLLQL